MAKVIDTKKSCAVYPLKLSQPMGAAYCFLGIDKSMPIMHGSQGCAAFAKTFLTRHFREPIPMQTTALSEIATVIGGDSNIHEAIKNVIDKNNPNVVGLVSTGVSETRGDDIIGSLKRFKSNFPDYADKKIVYVSTPDYLGSFETGYEKALLEVVKALVEPPRRKYRDKVNIFVSYALTAGDIEEIKDMLKDFELDAVVIPDFSRSIGLMSDFSPITIGGTTLEEIQGLASSSFSIAIGYSSKAAAEYLEKEYNVPMFYFESLLGLKSTDEFYELLIKLTGREPSDKYKRYRSRLLDTMADGQFYFSGKSVALGLGPDLLTSLVLFLKEELGLNIEYAVSPVHTPNLDLLPIDTVYIGDLEDIKLNAKHVDMIISNTNGQHIAKYFKVPLLRIGIPIFDRVGHFFRTYVGYKGTLEFLCELTNLFLEHDEEKSYEVPEFAKQMKEEIL